MKCDTCNGQGWSWFAFGNKKKRAQCHVCEGEGTIPDDELADRRLPDWGKVIKDIEDVQTMSKNTAKTNEPIWDSRNSDELNDKSWIKCPNCKFNFVTPKDICEELEILHEKEKLRRIELEAEVHDLNQRLSEYREREE